MGGAVGRDESREVRVLCTPRGLASRWVHTEIGASMALHKRLVPVLPYGVSEDDLPATLAGNNAVSIGALSDHARRTRTRIDGSLMG